MGLSIFHGKRHVNFNADEAEKQLADISMGIGSTFDWVSYPDNDQEPYRLAQPPWKKSTSTANLESYTPRLGMVLRSPLRRKSEIEVHYPILLNRAQLNSHMNPERIKALKEVGFEYDIQKGKSCVIAALAYFADIGKLVGPEDLLDSAVLKHIIDILDKVQPPLPPDTSAAALPHDPIVPNPA
ncbi:hypothetical protein C8R42DRAFT_646840 [Lentinula raphanica]|nr:hypothetical protein C8R42DRAFT_646840 [Lentinula raphanica]